MSLEILQKTLGWCAVINIGIILFWFLLITFGRNWVYKIHRIFFNLSKEQLSAIHYTGLMLYKLALLVFFIVPYFALRIAG